MHSTAYAVAGVFLLRQGAEGQRILEIGSGAPPVVAGQEGGAESRTLRSLCPQGATWVGLDLAPGAGVDVVASGHEMPFEAEEFDLVVSSSCLEHDPMFWLTFGEACRVLRPGGLIYLNVPMAGPYHCHPGDCWRFYPDAADALGRWGCRLGYDIALIEHFTTTSAQSPWQDHVMLYRKGKPHEEASVISSLRSAVSRTLSSASGMLALREEQVAGS